MNKRAKCLITLGFQRMVYPMTNNIIVTTYIVVTTDIGPWGAYAHFGHMGIGPSWHVSCVGHGACGPYATL
jgi:hypothetical protein